MEVKVKVSSKKDDAIIKDLRRLCLAIDSFGQCRELAEHLRDPSATLSGHAMSAALAGITSTYGKNFNAANRIGSLGPDFRSFEDPNMQVTHDRLIEYRNTRHSHRDADHNGFKLSDGTVDYFPVEVTLHDGRIFFQPRLIEIPKARLGCIIELMDHQMGRAQIEVDKRVKMIATNGVQYSEEVVYLLGKSFP